MSCFTKLYLKNDMKKINEIRAMLFIQKQYVPNC